MSENVSILRLKGPRSVSGASFDILVEEQWNAFVELNRPGFEHMMKRWASGNFDIDEAKFTFKYNPSIWGFKRPESFDSYLMENPIRDMIDEVYRSTLSQIDPYSKYDIELVKETGIVRIKWEE